MDFLNPDTGLVDLGAAPPATSGIESIGPISIGGDNEVFGGV